MRVSKALQLSVAWWRVWGTLPVWPWTKATCLYGEGRFLQAIPFYQAGLAAHSGHPAEDCIRLDLAHCLLKTGDYSGCEAELSQLADRFPDSHEVQIRLAQFQLWTGHAFDAALTLRRAIQRLGPEVELASLFLYATQESGSSDSLYLEALQTMQKVSRSTSSSLPLLVAVCQARQHIAQGYYERGRAELARLAFDEKPCVEALLAFSELVFKEEKIALCRQLLRRAMQLSVHHPRVLSMLAETYLRHDEFGNAAYAQQLAALACQHSNWSSVRELHILACAYHCAGDRCAALLIASKAKDVGGVQYRTYPQAQQLDELIDRLSVATLF